MDINIYPIKKYTILEGVLSGLYISPRVTTILTGVTRAELPLVVAGVMTRARLG